MTDQLICNIEEVLSSVKSEEDMEGVKDQFDDFTFDLFKILFEYKQSKGLKGLFKKRKVNKRLRNFLLLDHSSQISPSNEDLLIQMLQYADNQDLYNFLFSIIEYIEKKMKLGSVTLTPKNEFIVLSGSLIPYSFKTYQYGRDYSIDRELFQRVEKILPQLTNVPSLIDEFVPFYATLIVEVAHGINNSLINIRQQTKDMNNWLGRIFKHFTLQINIKFMQEFKKSVKYGKQITTTIIDAIPIESLFVITDDILDQFFDTMFKSGIRIFPSGISETDLTDIPINKRLNIAAKILQKFEPRDLPSFTEKLLFLDDIEKEDLYNYEIPESVYYFYIRAIKSKKILRAMKREKISLIPEIFFVNKKAIMGLCLNFQQTTIKSVFFIELVSRIPNEIHHLLMKDASTRAIFRNQIRSVISLLFRDKKYEKIIRLLKMFGQPYSDLLPVIETYIGKQIILSKGNKELQDFLGELQSKLLEENASAEVIQKFTFWLKIWSLTNKAAQSNRWQYHVNLLDIITETQGEFFPDFIINNVIGLKNQQKPFLENEDSDNFREWLLAVKRGYYKLQILANDRSLSLTDEIRARFRAIACDLLAFVIIVRRQNLMNKIRQFSVDARGLLDPQIAFQQGVAATPAILLPPNYLTFPTPALRVLNEIIKWPIKIPIAGSNQTGVCVYGPFWTFGCGMTLIGPAFTNIMGRISQDEFFDEFLHELLKTYSLVLKRVQPLFHEASRGLINSEGIIITTLKNLPQSHMIEFTREQVMEILEVGGWDSALVDRIIEKKDYCLYCSAEMPTGSTTCSNCGKEAKEIDLSEISFDDISFDVENIGDIDDN